MMNSFLDFGQDFFSYDTHFSRDFFLTLDILFGGRFWPKFWKFLVWLVLAKILEIFGGRLSLPRKLTCCSYIEPLHLIITFYFLHWKQLLVFVSKSQNSSSSSHTLTFKPKNQFPDAALETSFMLAGLRR